MKREFLEELLKAIEDDTSRKDMIDKIMNENGKSINTSKTKIDELTGQLGLITKERDEAHNLIADLKKSNAGNEELQGKVSNYEAEIAKLKEENEQLRIDDAIKVELLGAKAISDDIEYLMFQIKKNDAKLSLTEDGKIKGLNIEEIKTAYPRNFEVESKKTVEVNNLPKIEDNENTVTKEQFDKMGYSSRVKLKEENPEMYNTLAKKN